MTGWDDEPEGYELIMGVGHVTAAGGVRSRAPRKKIATGFQVPAPPVKPKPRPRARTKTKAVAKSKPRSRKRRTR